MHINWLGQTCVKIQTKQMDTDVTILIDSYKPEKGDFPRNLAAQVALFSKGTEGSITITQNPFILSTLGEVEIKNIMVYAFSGSAENIIFRINAEGMNLVHLGKQNKKLEPALIEKIGVPDILFIPVGDNKEYLSPEDAVDTINELEPRMVIPVGHKCDTDQKALSVQDFIKKTGLGADEPINKLIIKKKDLPQEERKVVILEKNY